MRKRTNFFGGPASYRAPVSAAQYNWRNSMFRKSYSYIILAAVIVFAAHLAAYAQFAPVNGTVVTQKDGKSTPVADALIEVYRTDIKGTFPSTTTKKRGEFNFVGMPYGATYVFSVSAPKIGRAHV